MPECRDFSTRLPAELEPKPIHKGLDRLRGARVLFGMMKYDGQHEGTLVFFNGHPFIREQYTGAAVHIDDMMIIVYKLLCLFPRTDSNRLVGVDLIKLFGHPAFILQASS